MTPTNPERVWVYTYAWARPPHAVIGMMVHASRDAIGKALAVTRSDEDEDDPAAAASAAFKAALPAKKPRAKRTPKKKGGPT